jgi:hypothetical protein
VVTGGADEDKNQFSNVDAQEGVMKWTGAYLIGYAVLVGGIFAALWKMGILERIGVAWSLIGLMIVIGIGIMLAVSSRGNKDNIEISRK